MSEDSPREGPTPERVAKADGAWRGNDGAWRIPSAVAALRRSGKIGDAEVQAADRFAADYAFGIVGARISDPNHTRGTHAPGGVETAAMVARLDAATRYREAREALGRGAWLLHAICTDELTIRQCSVILMVREHAASERAATLFGVLADHYARKDGAKKGAAAPIRAAVVTGWGT